MQLLQRCIHVFCCRMLVFATLTAAGTAAAVSWTHLDGPYGGQPFALFNDASDNTWAGMNGSGVFVRAAGATRWELRPGMPTQSNSRIAIGGTGTAYVSGSAGVYALDAGDGAAWRRVSGTNGLPGQAGSGMTSDAQGAVYVGMGGPGGVFKLDSGATTWAAVGTGLPNNSTVNNLVFDGAGNLWASIYASGVYKLPAGGGMWTAINTGLDNLNIQALAVVGNDLFSGNQFHGAYKLANASGGGTAWVSWNGGTVTASDAIYRFANGAGGTLYAAGYSTVHALAGGASTWTKVGMGLESMGPTYSLAYSSQSGALTLGNGTGIQVLAADGTAWQDGSEGMAASTINGLAVAANGDVYAATFGQGVQRLANGAAAWTTVNPTGSAASINAIAIDGLGTVYSTLDSNVLKLVGGAWVGAGLDLGGFPYSLAVDASNALWAGQNGAVKRLPFGTASWLDSGGGLPTGTAVNALAFDAAGTAYAGMYGLGIYTLAAGGATWTLSNAGLSDLHVQTLVRDPAGTVHAGLADGVFRFVSGSWQRVGTGLVDSVLALAFAGNGDIYAGIGGNYAYRLPAGGTAWSQVKLGLASRTVSAMAAGGGRVYAGTDGSGGSPSGVYTLVTLDSVVEFYNSNLDNFFITADPAEQAAVDSGAAGPGWSRTGEYFNAGGPSKVCRFYGSLSPGPNSHFYTIDPAECQALKDLQASTPITEKRWNFESDDFFSSSPVAGQCASGQVPVYRAYNNGFTRGIDSNHRITASHAGYLAQVAKGWSGEGVVMCAPAQ